ncbi:MAG TPA: hypothetical protein PKA00_04580 [Saprospiraceae bacterium]|nr:hypothetical protein [Saprospiraceae bacterium]HMQ82156.1 hypothetical protein [Saprospiraceae bacterium]
MKKKVSYSNQHQLFPVPFFRPVIQRNPDEEQNTGTTPTQTGSSATESESKDAGNPPFRLKTPAFGESWRKPRSFSLYTPQLSLDPEIEAQMRTFRMLHSSLYFPNLLQATSLLNTPSPAVKPNLLYMPPDYYANQPSAFNFKLPPPPANKPLITPGKGPEKPREGKIGDLVKAVLSIPAVKTEVDKLKDQAGQQVQDQWSNLSQGGKAAVITSAIVLGAGGAAGLSVMPDTQRRTLLKPISGVEIPIPSTPLSVQYQQVGQAEQVMLKLDVAKLLRKK